MSSSLLILTHVSRKIDETDRKRYRREKGRGKQRGQKERKKKVQNQPLGLQSRVAAGGSRGLLEDGAGRHLFPLHPRMAEEATGSDKMGPKMVDYVTVINPKIMLTMCQTP